MTSSLPIPLSEVDLDQIDDWEGLYEGVEASCPLCPDAARYLSAHRIKSGWVNCSGCGRKVTLSDDVRKRIDQSEEERDRKATATIYRRELLGDIEAIARVSAYFAGRSIDDWDRDDDGVLHRACKAVRKLANLYIHDRQSAAVAEWLLTWCNPGKWRDLPRQLGYAFADRATVAKWQRDLSRGNDAARVHGMKLLTATVTGWRKEWPPVTITHSVIPHNLRPLFIFGERMYTHTERAKPKTKTRRVKRRDILGPCIAGRSRGRVCRECGGDCGAWRRLGMTVGSVYQELPVAVCNEYEAECGGAG